jgi:cytochrome c-type biogenesis protein CcmH/NrfF
MTASLPYFSEPANPSFQLNTWTLFLIGAALAFLGTLAFNLIKRRQKVEPLPAKRPVKKKRTKK